MNCITKDWWYTAIVIGMILGAAWLAFSIAGCQSPPPVARKPACDGEQCKRQVTPNDVIKKKPLVYY